MIKSAHKILIVDDDKDILDLLKYNLEKDGYEVVVERKSVNSLQTADHFQPDLIILDVMMPKVNGIELCRQLRSLPKFQETYIFFLSAKSDRDIQTLALDTGGDDYIEKITGLRALTHKVGTVLKKELIIRKGIGRISIGGITVDRKTRSAIIGRKVIPLSKYEFELLYFFAQNPRKTITNDNLLHNIWGSDIYLLARSVENYINNLIQKLGTGVISKVGDGQYRFSA